MNYKVYVISRNRPMNVYKMRKFLGEDVTWVITPSDNKNYELAGAKRRFCASGLVEARNYAIEDARQQGAWCVQISDDLINLRSYTEFDEKPEGITVTDAIQTIIQSMEMTGAHLGGVAPTDNPYFSNRKVNTDKFIVGDFIVVNPATPLRFDPRLTLKEDYDYTLQHMQFHGKVARCDYILATFAHRKNRGGAVDDRTPEKERENIQLLKAKWGRHIVDNPRRQNEVLMKWRLKNETL